MNADEAQTVADIVARLDAIETTINNFIESVKPIIAEITPTIDAIMASPIGRMMVGKKK